MQDVVHSNHLGKNGAVAEGVAQCVQPGSDLTVERNELECASVLQVMGVKC